MTKKIFKPVLPVEMSTETKGTTYTVDYDFNLKKYIVSDQLSKASMSFAELGFFVCKKDLMYINLGSSRFKKRAVHLREYTEEWLKEESNALIYSEYLDRVIMYIDGKLFLEGEILETLPVGRFFIDPINKSPLVKKGGLPLWDIVFFGLSSFIAGAGLYALFSSKNENEFHY